MYLVSRTETFAKLFFIVSFTGLFMYVALAFYSFHAAYTTVSQIGKYEERLKNNQQDEEDRFDKDLKYILVWTKAPSETFKFEGQATFIERNCPQINCYITTNKTILNNDYTNFDAIVFNSSLITQWKNLVLPKKRAKRQKYVFYGMQASDSRPICNVRLDNYFNWTWTYKFYSDIFTPFIIVKDLAGNVVAPKRVALWTTDITSLTTSVTEQVNTKTKAIAWVLDECSAKITRMISTNKLKRALKEFNLTLDIYGCGNLNCPSEGCSKMIQRDYYFYLADERSMSEDYVTTEVLKAYDNDAVPVVVGGADYVKFLPDESYINFQFYTEEKLAALLHYTIKNPTVYNAYFNWKNHYTIEKADLFKGFCELCQMLNDKRKFNAHSAYESFRSWWYFGSLKEKCYPRGAEKFSEIREFENDTARM